MLRIGIAGGAGTGKSSFADALAKELSIPFLKSKDITQDILNRDRYDYSSGIQIERFLANSGRQNEILRRTLEQESVDEFITDRTMVDLAAYALCEMNRDLHTVKHIYETCQKNVKRYTHLFLCPWRNVPMADNGRRTLNPWYQLMIHVIEMGIMDDWGCRYYILQAVETQGRVVESVKLIRQAGNSI